MARRVVEPCALPQVSGNSDRVNFDRFLPRCFVASSVQYTMMGAAERDSEFIADPAAQGLGLHESQVMGVARLPPGQKARLRRHELQMGTIAVAARLAQGKRAFVEMPENGVFAGGSSRADRAAG